MATFSPEFPVQLTPTAPDAGGKDFVVQAGPYNSLFVRLRSAAVTEDGLAAMLGHHEPSVRGALYCAIPEDVSRPQLFALLRRRGYAWWNYEPSTREFIFYRWCDASRPDMVPTYATSIEGAGLIVLSPDESKVLLVLEAGRWVFPGGAGDHNETSLETAVREAGEETGVQLDPAFAPLLVGGWNSAGYSDRKVNNHYLIFLSRARSEAIELDNVEITAARWVPIAQLQPAIDRLKEDETAWALDHDGQMYSTALLFAVRRYQRGQALNGRQVHEGLKFRTVYLR